MDEIGGPIALDPFGTGPMGYRTEDGGFVVYSVGTDGSYDAEDTTKRPDFMTPTFRWPLPSYFAN